MKKILLFLTLTLTQFVYANEITEAVAQSPDLKIQILKDGRKVLASTKGLTLYTFDNDTAGISTCFGGCLKAWPIIETAQASILIPFSIKLRTDGKKQISFNNQPLYFYVADKIPGDIKGDGVGGIWHLVEVRE